MAKYNLLDDDDIFDEKDDISSDDDLNIDPEIPNSNAEFSGDIDINIDDGDDLIETEPSSSLDDNEFQTDLDITAIDNENIDEPAGEPEIEDSEASSFEYNAEEEQKQDYSDSPPFITDDYEDTKQEGLNYKPFLIGIVIVIALAAVYFALDTFVFSGAEPEVVEEPAKTPEQLQQEKIAAEKAVFLGRIAGKTSSDINLVNEILGYGKNNARVSSVLLYKESLLFEVFGSKRDEVAKVNMSLKNSSKTPFEVVGSETRPGSNGGVFGLFKTEVSPSASSRNVDKERLTSVNDFQAWVEQSSGASNLKVTSLKNNYLSDEGLFKKYEVETTINGSLDDCSNFLQKLATENNQVKIDKLNLTAADQRNFQTKKYLLKLVLEVYV
jgi:Type II secretion system (T2SS), protein M subtype b